jgi:drug/metabolite transporter (DMT)-like permease
LRGVALLLASLLLLAALSALVKFVSPRQSLPAIMFFRFAGSLVPLVWVLGRTGGVPLLKTRQPMQHAVRSFFGIVGIAMYFYALGAIPIADATALSYSAPLFLIVFAIVILGERVAMSKWIAVAAGFAGMLLIAMPRGHGIGLGHLAAIGSAVFGALVSVWLRRLSRVDAPVAIALYYNFAGALVALIWVVFSGAHVQWGMDAAWMAAIGLLAGVQQYLRTSAFRFAEASLLAPLDYALLIYAALIGWIFWGEVPTSAAVAGAVVIVASGLFIVRGQGGRA